MNEPLEKLLKEAGMDDYMMYTREDVIEFAKLAILEGFDFIGIEQDKEYVKIARARIKFARYKVKKKSGQTKNRPIE